jgi:folate-binding protein YgfZ
MTLALHELHQSLNARFGELNAAEIVTDYGDASAEYTALRETAGVLDFSFRGRLCLVGADRVRFLHGQITNDVKRLRPGAGCYAALTTAKGKMESDLNVLALADELLLDFEPGLSAKVAARLEKYIVADDVQVVDAAPHYGLLSVQGPKAGEVIRALGLPMDLPAKEFNSVKVSDATLGEIYVVNLARLGLLNRGVGQAFQPAGSPDFPVRCSELATGKSPAPADRNVRPTTAGEAVASVGFDLYVPVASLGAVADKLIAAAKALGGRACGWTAFETARIEAGIPRYGADMDETCIPLECGLEARAVSYQKGCYIGQEVINRIHSIGHVNRELRRLRLADDLPALPARGDKLFHDDKEVGYITSAVKLPTTRANVALGYVRREVKATGTVLQLVLGAHARDVKVLD